MQVSIIADFLSNMVIVSFTIWVFLRAVEKLIDVAMKWREYNRRWTT